MASSLEGSLHQLIVYSDHKNLTYFQTARVLSRRQAHWSHFLSCFDFIITYRPGAQQAKVDALSRRSYLAPHPGEPAFEEQKLTLLGSDRVRQMIANISQRPFDSSLLYKISANISGDLFVQDILDHILPDRASCSRNNNSHTDYDQFTWQNGFLFRKDLLYIQMALLDSKSYNNVMIYQWLDTLEFRKP